MLLISIITSSSQLIGSRGATIITKRLLYCVSPKGWSLFSLLNKNNAPPCPCILGNVGGYHTVLVTRCVVEQIKDEDKHDIMCGILYPESVLLAGLMSFPKPTGLPGRFPRG